MEKGVCGERDDTMLGFGGDEREDGRWIRLEGYKQTKVERWMSEVGGWKEMSDIGRKREGVEGLVVRDERREIRREMN